TRWPRDWSSDVCSSDLPAEPLAARASRRRMAAGKRQQRGLSASRRRLLRCLASNRLVLVGGGRRCFRKGRIVGAAGVLVARRAQIGRASCRERVVRGGG